MVIGDLRVDQLSIGADIAAVVRVSQLRGHVRLVQVLVDHQGRVHRLRLRRRVHDFAVRVFGGGNPSRIFLNFRHWVHLSMVERLKVAARRTGERSATARYRAGASVRSAVDSRRQRVVRHRRRSARQTTVRSVLAVCRKRVEVLNLTDERIVNRRPVPRR